MAEKIATQMETTLVNQYGLDNDVTDVWDDLQSKVRTQMNMSVLQDRQWLESKFDITVLSRQSIVRF